MRYQCWFVRLCIKLGAWFYINVTYSKSSFTSPLKGVLEIDGASPIGTIFSKSKQARR